MKTEHKVVIKATGNNGSGKSYLLKIVRDFLESEGFKVSLLEHEIIVLNKRR